MKKLNKRANFDYEILDRLEVGIVLSGAEAKAVRSDRADISRSYAKIINNELWLVNANIPVTGIQNYNPTRSRKLLLHKSELVSLGTKIGQGKLTIVPVKVYTKGRRVKLEIALARSKKEYQKKDSLKQKDIERDTQRELRIKE